MAKALERYAAIVEENKDEPKAHYMHTRHRLYPGIAVFDAMTAEGIPRTETADFLVWYYRWRASGMAPKIKAIFKLPGLYKAVPRFFFNMTQRMPLTMGLTSGLVAAEKASIRAMPTTTTTSASAACLSRAACSGE